MERVDGIFYICQDKRYKNPPRIQNFYDQYYPNLFCPEHHDKIKDKNVVYANSRQPVEFIDLISGPVLLVSGSNVSGASGL